MTRRVITANLRLLSTDAGGRCSPVETGYRSLVRFQGTDKVFGFELDLDSDQLFQGRQSTARLSFWAIEDLPDLFAGQAFELLEGTRVVGHGTITEPNL